MEERFKKFREEYIRTESERLHLVLREIVMNEYVNLSPTEIAFHIDRKSIVTSVLKKLVEEISGDSHDKKI